MAHAQQIFLTAVSIRRSHNQRFYIQFYLIHSVMYGTQINRTLFIGAHLGR